MVILLRVAVLATSVLALAACALLLGARSGEAQTTAAQRNQMLTLVNDWRVQNGLGTLALNPSAIQISENLASCNAASNSLNYGCGGTHVSRVTAQNCTSVTGTGDRLGEAILLFPAASPSTVQAAFDAWKSDPGTNTALLIPSATQLGVGQSDSGTTGNHFWAIDLVRDCLNATDIPTPQPTPSPTPTPIPDADGDTVADLDDNCPNWPNAGQALPTWPISANDADCDGFASAHEAPLGTDPTSQCPATVGVDDVWPPDFDRNRVVNILDVLAIKPVFNLPVASYPRFDLSPGGGANINIVDVLVMKTFFTMTCVP